MTPAKTPNSMYSLDRRSKIEDCPKQFSGNPQSSIFDLRSNDFFLKKKISGSNIEDCPKRFSGNLQSSIQRFLKKIKKTLDRRSKIEDCPKKIWESSIFDLRSKDFYFFNLWDEVRRLKTARKKVFWESSIFDPDCCFLFFEKK